MNKFQNGRRSVPRIESLRIQNYRALHRLELTGLTPLTVLLGPNGSGKSTVFDVFAFLSECFTESLRKAWDRRGRFKELRTRGSDGQIVIELQYRERPDLPLITYHLAIDEVGSPATPVVAKETLRWKRGSHGKPFHFLDYSLGKGWAISGELPEKDDNRLEEVLSSPDVLAINTLGQFEKHPRVSALRKFITGWYLSYLSANESRGVPEAGPQERLSQTGHNLPNVIQYLKELHPSRLVEILEVLSKRVPRLEKVDVEVLLDGRLLMRFKDKPFLEPVLAKYVSDGTLKMLSYLTLLYDPDPPQLIGIEEPENFLHPRLLLPLAEECRRATANAQMMVTTHSPFFVNGLHADELWVLYRDEDGYTEARRASDMVGIGEFMEHGAQLGHLWMEGHFEVGDPLTSLGGPKPHLKRMHAR